MPPNIERVFFLALSLNDLRKKCCFRLFRLSFHSSNFVFCLYFFVFLQDLRNGRCKGLEIPYEPEHEILVLEFPWGGNVLENHKLS